MKKQVPTTKELQREIKTLRCRVAELSEQEAGHQRTRDALMEAVVSVENEITQAETIIAAIGDGISIQDTNMKILYQNEAHKALMGVHVGESCLKAYQWEKEGSELVPIAKAFKDGKAHRMEIGIREDGMMRFVEVTASCLTDTAGAIVAGVEIVRDITARRLAEAEREALITELRLALAKIKTLTGLLPICASCKKIRDDQGYWNKIEKYLQSRTNAEFTHGLCPDCAKTLYPGYYEDLP